MKRYLSWFVLTVCACTFARSVCMPQNAAVENGNVVSSSSIKTLLYDDFSKADNVWEIVNHKDRLKMERKNFMGKPSLVITPVAQEKEIDTAFMLTSKVFELKNPGRYALTFEASANFSTVGMKGYKERYRNRINFFDGYGIKIGERIFRFDAPDKVFGKTMITGECPKDTRAISVSFGGDHPNIAPENILAFANVKLQVQDRDGKWAAQSEFISGVIPAPANGGRISWKLSGKGATARFQIAAASDENGFPGKFTPFYGPDGTGNTWFVKNNTVLPPFREGTKWVRYKAQLVSKNTPAVLKEVTVGTVTDSRWLQAFDVEGPLLTRTSESPTADGTRPLTVKVDDPCGVDWSSAKFTLDGQDVRKEVFPTPDGFALRPAKAFADGIHELNVTLSDWNGNKTAKSLFFRIGKKAEKNIVTVRDDGMTLVDGKPFFPIGIYSVVPHKFHGGNINSSMTALKEAGINFVQTYRVVRNDEFRQFMDSAARHGMKVWVSGSGGSNDHDLSRIAKSLAADIDNPALLAWYIADDTIVYNAPWQLRERTELVKALAPHLITVHADEVWDDHYGSKFRDFADTAPAFLPELYPVHYLGDEDTLSCVAKIIRDMEQIKADTREKDLPPRSIWPIIQYFHGWSWQRYPTPVELRAMSFASLIHGAHGITWYTYNSSGKNKGVTSSPEIWNNFTRVSKEISSYAPVFVERDAKHQIVPQITGGDVKNVLGTPSISALTKEHDGKTYLFTVNSVMKNVKAKFDVKGFKNCKDNTSGADVKIDNGVLNVDFEPYAVKIYILEK